MSLGMGLTFVPLTLTAVHHLRAEDSGIGSGVLNTMQQVGGALGLATARHRRDPDHRRHGRRAAVGRRRRPRPPAARSRPQAQQQAMQVIAAHQVFTDGATAAFLARRRPDAGRLARDVWLFLNVKHEELATDGPPEGVVV